MNVTRIYNVMYKMTGFQVGLRATFLFHVSSEARGAFSTSKSDQRLVAWVVYSSNSSI